MAKVIFTEGGLAKLLADTGWPSTVNIALSTKPCSSTGAHVVGDTLAGGFGEITGTGYARQSVSEPAAASDGSKTWPTASFATGSATNWPAAVKSAVVIDPGQNKLLAALDLTATRDMSGANTTLTFTLSTTSAVT